MEFLIFVLVVGAAIVLLKGFDAVAGRGPKQVKDGIDRSTVGRASAARVPCPQCAEMIMPAAKLCPFCKSKLGG